MKVIFALLYLTITLQAVGQNSSKKWFDKLPPCPCTYAGAIKIGKTSFPSGQWKEYPLKLYTEKINLPKFHYGAIHEVRWIPDAENESGQQCTYDSNGNLINGGLAVGTPDLISPGHSILPNKLHITNDVEPWKKMPCIEYLEKWPPNKGEYPCNRKDNTVNTFIHLIDYVNSLTCEDIIWLFKDLLDVPNANLTVREFMGNGIIDDRDKAKFLLQYFRGYSTKVKGKNRTGPLKFSNAVIKYLEEYLVEEPGDITEVKTTFVIDLRDVTLSSAKTFKWFDWEDASEDIKTATKYLKTDQSETLFDEIKEYIENKCEVKVALTDLNNDGIAGLSLFASGGYCCGTMGCTFRLYENGGLMMVDLGTDHEVKPAKNGVSASTGRFFGLKRNPDVGVADQEEINRLFTYRKPEAKPQTSPVNDARIVGGASPEELGKILLNALKTNDKAVWIGCFAPKEIWTAEALEIDSYDGINKYSRILKLYTERFDHLRNKLEENGFSNPSNIKFSRVLFKRIANDEKNAIIDGELMITNFYIEFTYGSEFVGRIGGNDITTYKKGKYFVGSQGGLLETGRLR